MSCPTTLSPATASALAESPSVKIKVHFSDLVPPAKLASQSFAMFIMLDFFDALFSPSVFDRLAFSSSSTMPDWLATAARYALLSTSRSDNFFRGQTSFSLD